MLASLVSWATYVYDRGGHRSSGKHSEELHKTYICKMLEGWLGVVLSTVLCVVCITHLGGEAKPRERGISAHSRLLWMDSRSLCLEGRDSWTDAPHQLTDIQHRQSRLDGGRAVNSRSPTPTTCPCA